MGYKLGFNEMNKVRNQFKNEYIIYAPKRFEKEGRYSDTDIIRYAQVEKIEEIEWEEK